MVHMFLQYCTRTFLVPCISLITTSLATCTDLYLEKHIVKGVNRCQGV